MPLDSLSDSSNRRVFNRQQVGLRQQFMELAHAGDVNGMRALIEAGLDLTLMHPSGETLLEHLILYLHDLTNEQRLAMVKEAVCCGADPGQVGKDNFGPLVPAMLYMDADLLCYLLESGADPNTMVENGGPLSLYDWAWSDYMVTVWDINKVPEEPTEEDKASEEGWIAFFDRIAVMHGKQRPTHLAVLRARGALTRREIEEAI